MVETALCTCLMLKPSSKASSRAWNACKPTAGSTTTWRIISGSFLAISSISMPPARSDHADALGFAVEHEAEINLAVERLGDLDIDALHRLALRARSGW